MAVSVASRGEHGRGPERTKASWEMEEEMPGAESGVTSPAQGHHNHIAPAETALGCLYTSSQNT